ncbi:MAG: aspartate/glutamate racemase family protein [Mesorhizobium sp.]
MTATRNILVIVPFPLDEEGVGRRRDQLKAVELSPNCNYYFRPVRVGAKSFMSPHDWLLADVAIFEAGCKADEEGYDAVCIDTMSDSGLSALRSVLDIPVVAPGKASMLYAMTLGSKFSILSQWKPGALKHRKAVAEHGLAPFCASIRTFDIPPDFDALLAGKEDEVFPRMLSVCMQCVEEDGTEVICLGSTTMHQAAEWLAQRLPVPLVNPGPLTYKLAETALALRHSHSKLSFPRPLEPMLPVFGDMLDGAQRANSKE